MNRLSSAKEDYAKAAQEAREAEQNRKQAALIYAVEFARNDGIYPGVQFEFFVNRKIVQGVVIVVTCKDFDGGFDDGEPRYLVLAQTRGQTKNSSKAK